MKKYIWLILSVSIILLISLTVIYLYFLNQEGYQDNQYTKKYEFKAFDMDYSFAKFVLEKTEFQPNIPSYNLNYTELVNLQDFEKAIGTNFTPSQKQSLNENHFFIIKNLDKFYNEDPDYKEGRIRDNDWTYLYAEIGGPRGRVYRKPENSVFVTTDFLLHVYHKLLSKEFEYIEQTEFYPRLKEITDVMLENAIQEHANIKLLENRQSYERIIAYFAVPKAILDSAIEEFEATEIGDKKVDTDEKILSELENLKEIIPEQSYNLAREELELVLENSTATDSPIFSSIPKEENDDIEFKEDYTQYTPRARYTKDSVLRSYFRSMIWYGRNNFLLESEHLTRDAINIILLFHQADQVANWLDIYLPTSFLVGKSDDLGFYEYGQVLANLDFYEVDEELVKKVQKGLELFEGPEIMSSLAEGDGIFDTTKEELQNKTKGFRFMGQRFTPDAFIFTTLTQGDELPDPETGEQLPSSTTALMVMSVFGSDKARTLADEWIEKEASDSKNVLSNRLNMLRKNFDEETTEIWTQNIYWTWIYTLRSLFTESIDKEGYPEFMKRDLWNKKNLQASLGSWAELKHDTILYAKQSYAEFGSGGGAEEIPPVPKGYVEANIEFLDRLLALSKMTYEGLKSRDLLDQEFLGRNEDFIKSLEFFREIARKQIKNEIIEEEEFERLRNEAGSLSYVLRPLPRELHIEDNARSAVIADVHTDGVKQEILYQATGIPNYIYVAVKDINGTRLTKGLVYSYFEFTSPLEGRITNQDWRKINYREDKSEIPNPPAWTEELIK